MSGSVPAGSSARRRATRSAIHVSANSRIADSTAGWKRADVLASRASGATNRPCAKRRRNASGAMSTSSTWSAPTSTWSGTARGGRLPVSRSTTAPRDATVSMSAVASTSMPAASRGATSSQRRRSPSGRLGWCRSSIRTTSGRRRITASGSRTPGGETASKAAANSRAPGPTWPSTPITMSVPRDARRAASSSIAWVVPTPWATPRYTRKRPDGIGLLPGPLSHQPAAPNQKPLQDPYAGGRLPHAAQTPVSLASLA